MKMRLPRLQLGSLYEPDSSASPLAKLDRFGTNPGNLNGWFHKPDRAPQIEVPLVVVLHGCTQNAYGYDQGSGWSELASACGFATLFPEQQRGNNFNLCFNWFEPGDTQRAAGEAQSIAQMIEAMIDQGGIDSKRVYITGLSAGGAMTSVMLAAYPEMFAGGAILAGLPHGAAAALPEALQQMRSHSPTSRTTGKAIRSASPHRGRWPTISVWHGTADNVVSPSNAEAILQQWREVHDLPPEPDSEQLVEGYPHRVWTDGKGMPIVEEYRVTGMGHGAPLATGGDDGYGKAGAFMLEVGISSTVLSAKAWGLLEEINGELPVKSDAERSAASEPFTASEAAVFARDERAERIGRTIDDALRMAGLLR